MFSGGSPALFFSEAPEAEFAVRLLQSLGIPRERILVEEQSRNTVENAVFSKLIAQPKPGERWLLVTSAYHMPRSMGVFRAADFAVEAYPVDWRTRGTADALRPFPTLGGGAAAHRHRGARMDWPGGLLADGTLVRAFPAAGLISAQCLLGNTGALCG